MIKEKEIRFVLFILLFLVIFLYEAIGYSTDYISTQIGVELRNFDSLKIGRYLASIILILLLFRSKWTIKITGLDYIGGKYKGFNEELNDKGDVKSKVNEEFTIYQSLLKTSISGISNQESGELYSRWNGDLIERKDNLFTFSLEVETSKGKHFGIMNLRIDGDDAVGFTDYFSSGKVSFKEKLKATRVAKK